MIFIEHYPLKRCQGCVKLIASKVNCFLNINDLSEVQLCMSSNSWTWECPHTKDGADRVPLICLSSVNKKWTLQSSSHPVILLRTVSRDWPKYRDTFSTFNSSFQNYHMVLPQASPHHKKCISLHTGLRTKLVPIKQIVHHKRADHQNRIRCQIACVMVMKTLCDQYAGSIYCHPTSQLIIIRRWLIHRSQTRHQTNFDPICLASHHAPTGREKIQIDGAF